MTLDEILTALAQEPQLRARCLQAYRQLGATPRSRPVSHDDEIFAVPPPLPDIAPPPLRDPAVGRRDRRKVRRQAQYWEDRQATLCVACRKRPPAAAHLSRCTPCAEIQKRSLFGIVAQESAHGRWDIT